MADLNDKDSALTVKLTGANSSGTETNFVDVTVNGIKVDGSAVTQPVSVNSLPLPSGASTSALQTTGNSSLSSIDTKTPPLGQTTMSSSTPVTIASNQSDLDVVLKDSTGNELASFDLDNTGGTAKVLGVTLRQLSNGTPVEVGSSTNPIRVDPVGITNQPVLLKDGIGNALLSGTSLPLSTDRGLLVRQIPQNPATFCVISEATVTGNNKSMIALQNTSTSVIKIKEIWLINDRQTPVTGVYANFRLHRINSFTGGTTLTPTPYDTNDILPVGITASTNATISTETSLYRSIDWSTDEYGPGTADVESNEHAIQNVNPFWGDRLDTKALTIRQNQGLHVRCATNTNTGIFTLRIVFTVE